MGRPRTKDAGLPHRVYRGKTHFEFHPKSGGSINVAPIGATPEEIEEAHRGLLESLAGNKNEAYRSYEHRKKVSAARQAEVVAAKTPAQKSELRIRQTLRKLFHSARQRAVKCGRTYTITSQQTEDLINRCQSACELTGMPFSLDRKGCAIGPFSPSLDRIDSARGYEFDNVRIVCAAINLAMNQWGEDMFEEIARSYLAHKEVMYRISIY